VETDINAVMVGDKQSQLSATASLASQYQSVPAMSAAQSERQFTAAVRLIWKLRSRLDGDRVDTLIFLYKNMQDVTRRTMSL